MDECLRRWHPDEEEVEAILSELRPIIHEIADRDRRRLDAQIERAREDPGRMSA